MPSLTPQLPSTYRHNLAPFGDILERSLRNQGFEDFAKNLQQIVLHLMDQKKQRQENEAQRQAELERQKFAQEQENARQISSQEHSDAAAKAAAGRATDELSLKNQITIGQEERKAADEAKWLAKNEEVASLVGKADLSGDLNLFAQAKELNAKIKPEYRHLKMQEIDQIQDNHNTRKAAGRAESAAMKKLQDEENARKMVQDAYKIYKKTGDKTALEDALFQASAIHEPAVLYGAMSQNVFSPNQGQDQNMGTELSQSDVEKAKENTLDPMRGISGLPGDTTTMPDYSRGITSAGADTSLIPAGAGTFSGPTAQANMYLLNAQQAHEQGEPVGEPTRAGGEARYKLFKETEKQFLAGSKKPSKQSVYSGIMSSKEDQTIPSPVTPSPVTPSPVSVNSPTQQAIDILKKYRPKQGVNRDQIKSYIEGTYPTANADSVLTALGL